jgi:hypothetical protein
VSEQVTRISREHISLLPVAESIIGSCEEHFGKDRVILGVCNNCECLHVYCQPKTPNSSDADFEVIMTIWPSLWHRIVRQ